MKEKIKKKLSVAVLITCTSFTIIMTLYALIGMFIDTTWQMNNPGILVILATCAAVAVAITLTDLLPIGNRYIQILLDFLDVVAVVFLFGGGVLKMFPFKPKIMLLVSGMLCIAFFGVSIHLIRTEKTAAENINARILEIKKQNRRENYHGKDN